ncbi:hypothetical protein NBRC116599_19050 [Aquicoccus sp. SU-CL01552]
MGEVVADQFQRTRVIARHQFNRRPIGQGRGQITDLAINDRSHRTFGKARADGCREVGSSAGGVKRTGRAIGQADMDHSGVFLSEGGGTGSYPVRPRGLQRMRWQSVYHGPRNGPCISGTSMA